MVPAEMQHTCNLIFRRALINLCMADSIVSWLTSTCTWHSTSLLYTLKLHWSITLLPYLPMQYKQTYKYISIKTESQPLSNWETDSTSYTHVQIQRSQSDNSRTANARARHGARQWRQRYVPATASWWSTATIRYLHRSQQFEIWRKKEPWTCGWAATVILGCDNKKRAKWTVRY